MKKILPVFLTLTVIFASAGCSNTATNKEYKSTETAVASEITPASETGSAGENNNTQTASAKDTTTKNEMITINITVGSTTFTAKLEDNNTAKAFAAQLPITVNMSELNGNEKYNYLSSNLRADTSACPATINEGDFMLYGDNCLVLFYKTFKTSYSYVKLGHIDDTSGLAKVLGSGSAQITFSVRD